MIKIDSLAKWKNNSIFRYLVVGSWNTLFSVTLLYLLFYLFDNRYYEYEFGVSFLISTPQSYMTQKKFVWKSSTSPKGEFPRFVTAIVSQYLFNAVLLYLAVHLLKFKPAYCALPIMLTLTCGFYFVNKHIVFSSKQLKGND